MHENIKTKIYTAIFWLSLLVIAIWLLLKALGYIQSPIWVEIIPYAGAIFAMGAFFQILHDLRGHVWKLDSGLRRIASETIKLKINAEHTDKKFDNLEKSIDIRFNNMKKNIDRLFDKVDKRLYKIEQKL